MDQLRINKGEGFKVVLIVAILLAIGAFFIPGKNFPISWDFRNNLWAPAYLLVNRMSPYNIHAIFDFSNAIWMPWIIGLFFPIGYLPLQWASNLWLLINLCSFFAIVFIFVKFQHQSMILTLSAISSLFIFPSTISNFTMGQVSLLICLALAILLKYQNSLSPAIIGFLLAVSLTKPQLVVIFLPTYLLICFREKGTAYFLKMTLYTIAWVVLLCAPLFILYPNWIPDFFNNLSVNNAWFYPTLYSFLLSKFGLNAFTIIWTGIHLLFGMGIAVFLSFRLDRMETLLWSLAITPLFSPIIWSWDFVLLYPLIIFMIFQKKPKINTRVVLIGYGICTVIFIFMRINGQISDHLTFWVPIFLNSVLVLSIMLKPHGQLNIQTSDVL